MAVTPHDLIIEAKAQVKEVNTADAQAWNNEQRPTEKPEPINFE